MIILLHSLYRINMTFWLFSHSILPRRYTPARLWRKNTTQSIPHGFFIKHIFKRNLNPQIFTIITIMNTIARTTTLSRLNRRFTAYEHLDKTSKQSRGWRAFSTRRTTVFGQVKTQNYDTTMSPVCNKRDRARSRHIFLQGYKLSMFSTKEKLRSKIKLKKAMVKVKTLMVSVLSFMQAASLNKCNSKAAIAISSPSPVHRSCFWFLYNDFKNSSTFPCSFVSFYGQK